MLLLDPQTLDNLTETVKPRDTDPMAGLALTLKLLDDKDRLIVEMTLKHGMSRRQMGIILGQAAGTVSRRIRRILNRLHDPLINALAHPACPLAPEVRQLGIEYFLQRRTATQLSRRHGLSRPEIRAQLEYIRGWHRGHCTSR